MRATHDTAIWTGYPTRPSERLDVHLTVEVDGDETDLPAAVWRFSPTAPPPQPDGATPTPRILMIHGFRGDHHGMQLVADALPEYEIYAPDIPGFGETPPVPGAEHTIEVFADVLDALARTLDLGRHDILLGHSFGSIIASAHIARHQRRWAGLILMSPISDDVFRGRLLPGAAMVESYYRASELMPEPLARGLLRSKTILELTNLTMCVSGDPRITGYVRDQHDLYFGGYADRKTLLEAYHASSRGTVRQHADQLNLPVLLICGAKDPLSTHKGRHELARRLPDGHMEVLREVGHLIHYERPAEASRAIRRFLTGSSLPASALPQGETS